MTTKYLITSALPYINGVKHLGNLIGSMLPADVYARYLRQRRHEVLFICATDEHGTPAELAAADSGMSVEAYCARMHAIQADIYRRFHLSFDHLGRTSSRSNHTLTQLIYQQLRDQGWVEKRTTCQLYSPQDGRFLPDRYVVGTCPYCQYPSARGDQCESCATVLEPTDLLNARSAVSGSTSLELRDSTHVFLKLSELQPAVAQWVAQNLPQWDALTASIAKKWLDEGLQDRCISRDLPWGIAVPEADMEGKVFYVWFDAPIGYIAATWDWAAAQGQPEAWKSWWMTTPASQNTTVYCQFMAKDNVPFHTIMFPAMLLGTHHPWKQADRIKGFNWLNYYGGKFSTSAHRGVFLDTALELFEADCWRYALLAMAPESKDGTFTWEVFQSKINKDLNDTLGNFVNRTLRFATSRFGGVIPGEGVAAEAEARLEDQCRLQVLKLAGYLEALAFRKATETLRDLWALGNLYIDQEAPWKTHASYPHQAAVVIRTCINLIHLYATVSEPFIPATSAQMAKALGEPAAQADVWQGVVNLAALPPGQPVTLPAPLFQKIDPQTLAALMARFAGPQPRA